MADVKWIKITTDIFDDEKIKIIDTMPARDEILVIWFKLLSLAGRTNQGGALRMNSKMPYTNEMLAAVFNRNLNMVKLSLNIFQNYGMIEVEENETISIVNWDKHQNIEGLDKIRIQNKNRQQLARDKKKQLQIDDNHVTDNVTVTQDNATELDLELDIDKEINIKPIINVAVKKIEYAERVHMLEDEYEKLINKYSQKVIDDKITDLDLWKGSTGKKNKSDYLTLLTWLRKDTKVVNKQQTQSSQVTPKCKGV